MATATQNGASYSHQTNCIKAEINGTTKSTEKSTGSAVEGKPNLVLRKRILFIALALTLILLVLAVTTAWLVIASKSNKENLNERRVALNNKNTTEKEKINCTHSHTTAHQINDYLTTSTLAPEDNVQPETESKPDENDEVDETDEHIHVEESDEEPASDEIKPDDVTTESSAKSENSEENNESEEGSGSGEETTTTRQQLIYNGSFGGGSNPLTDDRVDTGSGDRPYRPNSKPCGSPWCDNFKVEEDVVNSEEEIVKVFSTQSIFSTTDGSVSPPPGVSDDDYVFNENFGFLPAKSASSSSEEDDDGSGGGLSQTD